jgi:hypothetical protein
MVKSIKFKVHIILKITVVQFYRNLNVPQFSHLVQLNHNVIDKLHPDWYLTCITI